MKKTITLAVLLFAMILSSCADNTNSGTQTTESTAPVSEVTTTAEVTTETTTGAGTESNTNIATETHKSENKLKLYEEYLDNILAEYEVIETNQKDFSGISNLENKPSGTYAIKFIDIPGAAVTASSGIENIYAFGKEIKCERQFFLEDFSGYIDEDGEGALVLTYVSGVNDPRPGWQYIITNTETLFTDMNKDRYNTTFSANPETRELEYYKYNKEFFIANNQGLILWLYTYESEEEVFEESGTFVVENGSVNYTPKESITLNQWYKSDDFGFSHNNFKDCKEKRDLWGYENFIEFVCNYGVETNGWTLEDLGKYKSLITK